jgi:hypothetical protein
MRERFTPAPRSGTLEAVKTLGDARYDADSAPQYTTSVSPGIHASRCPRLVTWLRCRQCCRGYFTAGAPGPQPCPACAGGRLQPVGLWDLVHEAAPPGLLRRMEVHRADLG